MLYSRYSHAIHTTLMANTFQANSLPHWSWPSSSGQPRSISGFVWQEHRNIVSSRIHGSPQSNIRPNHLPIGTSGTQLQQVRSYLRFGFQCYSNRPMPQLTSIGAGFDHQLWWYTRYRGSRGEETGVVVSCSLRLASDTFSKYVSDPYVSIRHSHAS
jgi:hypothetical protein